MGARTSVSPFVTRKGLPSGQCSGRTAEAGCGVGVGEGGWTQPSVSGRARRALPLCPRAKKVEALPTSCLFGAFCDHRWSGLGPRGGFKVLPPGSQGVAPKNKISRIRRSCSAPLKPGFGDILPGPGRVQQTATQSGGGSARWLLTADLTSVLLGSGDQSFVPSRLTLSSW